ncbi:MAG: glycoside hydrolase, partial [Acidobacteriota bacterium]
VGTHGRSFWILDNTSPRRQMGPLWANEKWSLVTPARTWRYRRSLNTDTPIPPEEPLGENPPDGALIDYWLSRDSREVTIEIRDAAGALVRSYNSTDPPEKLDPLTLPHPEYWVGPPPRLAASAGMHRFRWDLSYPPPEGFPRSLPISAMYRRTPAVH